MLLDTRPSLEQAQTSLHQAIAARQRIDPAALTPEARDMVLRVDPYLSLLDETLSVALSVPNLLGATEEGPKTYIILVQSEDTHQMRSYQNETHTSLASHGSM